MDPDDPAYGAFVIGCASTDGTRLYLENRSAKVLWVRSTAAGTTLELVSTPQEATLADYAGNQAAPGGYAADGKFILPRNSALVARQVQPPVNLEFDVDIVRTVVSNTARGGADWLEGILKSRAQQYLQRLFACAQSAAGFANQSSAPRLDDSLTRALNTSFTCGSLIRDALRELGASAPAPATARNSLLKATKTIAGGTYTDNLAFALLKLAPGGP